MILYCTRIEIVGQVLALLLCRVIICAPSEWIYRTCLDSYKAKKMILPSRHSVFIKRPIGTAIILLLADFLRMTASTCLQPQHTRVMLVQDCAHLELGKMLENNNRYDAGCDITPCCQR